MPLRAAWTSPGKLVPCNDRLTMTAKPPRLSRLSRREWSLVAIGLAAWIALGVAGVWFVHQLTRGQASCGTPLEARSALPQGTSASPRNAFQLLTGQGRCR